jgi:hypothetical protein
MFKQNMSLLLLVSQGHLLDYIIRLIVILSGIVLGQLCFYGMTLFRPLAIFAVALVKKLRDQ